MYLSISSIILACLAVWLFNMWQRVSIDHSSAVRNKNNLIQEAEHVISSLAHLSWNDMTDGQKEVHECAIERLRLLKSYKKNSAPDSFHFMREWPVWYDVRKNTYNR